MWSALRPVDAGVSFAAGKDCREAHKVLHGGAHHANGSTSRRGSEMQALRVQSESPGLSCARARSAVKTECADGRTHTGRAPSSPLGCRPCSSDRAPSRSSPTRESRRRLQTGPRRAPQCPSSRRVAASARALRRSAGSCTARGQLASASAARRYGPSLDRVVCASGHNDTVAVWERRPFRAPDRIRVARLAWD